MQNYIFDATFTENVLIVGRTGCGKTYFAQKLTVNRFFGRIKIVKWVLYIDLSGEREPEIDSSFSCKVEFRYLKSIEQFDDLLDIFKLRSKTAKRKDTDSNEDTSLSDDDDDYESDRFREKTTQDWFIVMDDIVGLANDLKIFASFLTVAHKFNYTCIYIFHITYPEKTIWRTILSQTNIFNIFPASVSLAHERRILGSVCIRKTRKDIPLSSLWISRLFIKLANRNDRVFLTLDCSGIKQEGPGRFRTEADKPDFQSCYFNVASDKQSYNEFVSQRINSMETDNRIQFKIIHLKSKANRGETFDATEELCDLNKNNGSSGTDKDNKKRPRTIFRTSYGSSSGTKSAKF